MRWVKASSRNTAISSARALPTSPRVLKRRTTNFCFSHRRAPTPSFGTGVNGGQSTLPSERPVRRVVSRNYCQYPGRKVTDGDLDDRNRMPFQVLVIPYRDTTRIQYAAFFRDDASYWQFIAGGGSRGENTIQAARREAEEEAGIPRSAKIVELQTVSSVSVRHFRARHYWPQALYVIPEFAVNAGGLRIRLSHEHTRVEWLSFDECSERLYWQSNQVALWELNERLRRGR